MSQTNYLATVYNPANQNEAELIANFVIRRKEFNNLITEIKNDDMKYPPQHFIIQGQRGSGKTTLLLRLYYEIKNDNELNQWLVPVIFNEEQYNIRTLYKLWENLASYLEDENEEFYGIYDEIQQYTDNSGYELKCHEVIKSFLVKNNKKLILFIDNFGDMLNKFSKTEHQRLREILMTESDIRIVGASSVVLEATYDYSQPFFEFFKTITLKGLSQEETVSLMLKLGENYKADLIKNIVENNPARIETLRRLTGGVPRTMILLFEIFVDDDKGDSFKDLEIILDRVTPLYKHRMDDLSPQQQEIADAIAMNWDAIGVKEIVHKTRMESKAVSSQLNQLEKNKIINKITTETKNNLYQISERFFNIWYLMRYGRKKDRTKLLWLVQFLENWCNPDELINRAQKHINALKTGNLYDKHALYLTEALSRTDIPEELQDKLIKATRTFLSEKRSELIKELSKSDQELFDDAVNHFKNKNFNKVLKNLLDIKKKNDLLNTNIAILYHTEIKDYKKAEKYYLMAVDKGNIDAMNFLAILYKAEFKDYKKAEKYFLIAVDKGNVTAINNLAILYHTEIKDYLKAEKYYLIAVDKGNVPAINNLAILYHTEIKDYLKAEKYYLMAVDKGNIGAMFNLANLYAKKINNYPKAEEYFRMAIEKGDIDAMANLAVFYFLKNKKLKALKLAETYLEKNKNPNTKLALSLILLWNNQIEKVVKIMDEFLQNQEISEELINPFEIFLQLLIAKKQYNYALNIFKNNKFNLKDRYKPIYYALMYFMQDVYPDEYKKMGEELKQTVEEIVSNINQMAVTYV